MDKMQSTPWGPRPGHWQIVPWGSFATPAGDPVVVEPDSDLKQVTIRVRHQGIVERRYSKNKKRSIGTPNQKQVRAGQFLISRIDARNGACGFVPEELDGAIVTSSFRAFDLDPSIIDPIYFDYLVGMPIFWQLCESISDGSTNRVCLDMDLFDSFVFPIPPLSEQNRVASVLQSIDKAIENTENVIAKTEQLRDALLHELLTRGLPGHHSEWKEVPGLGTIPATWKIARLDEVAQVMFSSVDKKSLENEFPVKLCNYTDVYYNRYIHREMDLMLATATAKEREIWTLRQGDVLFTKDSETPDDIGVPSYVIEDLPDILCGYHLGLARPYPKFVQGPFLTEVMRSEIYRRLFARIANGVTRFGLTLESTKAILIPLPPLYEQDKISKALFKVDLYLDKLKTQNLLLLNNSLSGELFSPITGKSNV